MALLPDITNPIGITQKMVKARIKAKKAHMEFFKYSEKEVGANHIPGVRGKIKTKKE